MKAHIPLTSRQREIITAAANAQLEKERNDYAARAQYLWALSMLQIGLSPKTVKRTAAAMEELIIPKYTEYKAEGLADIFAQEMLKTSGVTPPQTKFPQ